MTQQQTIARAIESLSDPETGLLDIGKHDHEALEQTLTSVYEEGEKTADEKWIKVLDEEVAALTNQNK